MTPEMEEPSVDPAENQTDLPDKPPLDIPAEPVAPPSDDEEDDVPEEDVLSGEEAADDPTIDDEEAEEQPHDPATLDIAEDEAEAKEDAAE